MPTGHRKWDFFHLILDRALFTNLIRIPWAFRYPPLSKGWESFALTPELANALDRFKQFYTQSHQGRLLEWRYQLFSLSLRANFPLGVKELSVSLFQALVLMSFNETEPRQEDLSSPIRLSWEEIRDRTGIGELFYPVSCPS